MEDEDGWNHDKYIVPDIVGMQYQGFFMLSNIQKYRGMWHRESEILPTETYFYIAKGNEENGRF